MSTPLTGRDRAREVVRRRMAEHKLKSQADLARVTGLYPNTVGDFLNAARDWPQNKTLTKIEDGLNLSRGLLNRIAEGGSMEPVERRDAPDRDEAELLAVEAENRLNPSLAAYTDDELIGEVRARTALYASRLHTHGESVLLHGLSRDGGDVIASRPKP